MQDETITHTVIILRTGSVSYHGLNACCLPVCVCVCHNDPIVVEKCCVCALHNVTRLFSSARENSLQPAGSQKDGLHGDTTAAECSVAPGPPLVVKTR